jgi:hypothetical protein
MLMMTMMMLMLLMTMIRILLAFVRYTYFRRPSYSAAGRRYSCFFLLYRRRRMYDFSLSYSTTIYRDSSFRLCYFIFILFNVI